MEVVLRLQQLHVAVGILKQPTLEFPPPRLLNFTFSFQSLSHNTINNSYIILEKSEVCGVLASLPSEDNYSHKSSNYFRAKSEILD